MAREVVCPTCFLHFSLPTVLLFFRWFFGADRDKLIAGQCPSTYCRNNR